MTERSVFERSLATWMADETSGGMAERAVIEVIDATARVRQSRRWLARLREPALRWDRQTAAGTSRRQLALVAVAALLALAAFAAVAGGWRPFGPAALADWNGFHAGPGRNGVSDAGPVGRPVLHWRFAAKDSVKDAIAIAGDLVIAPSQDGILHGIQLADGAERWRFAPGTSVTAPYVENGQVIVTDGHGIVHTLDLATGAERWHSSEVLDSATSPTAGNGLVVIGTGGGDLVALDAATGARRWRVRAATTVIHEPTLIDGIVYVTAGDGTIAAIRAADGTQVWARNVAPDPTGTPTVSSGILFVGSRSAEPGGRLRALDPATGATLWQTDEPWFAPAISGGLAISGRDDGVIVARDAATGTERWRFQAGSQVRGPAIVASTVFVSADAGQWIGAIDLATGRPLWRYDVDASNQCCIAVAKGYAVIGTMSGSVYAIGGDGTQVSPQPVGSLVTAGPPSPTTAPASTSPSLAPSATLPEPFTVVKVYAPADLGLDRPLGLAIGPSGDVYVSDPDMRITHLTASGTVANRWGRTRSASQFDFVRLAPTPTSWHGSAWGRTARSTSATAIITGSRSSRRPGSTSAHSGRSARTPEFTIPADVSADGEGNVYVLDDGLKRLTKFSAAGEPIWVADGSTDPSLDGHLHDADIDLEGRIVVMNDDLGKVVTLSPAGKVVDVFDAVGCDVTMDSAGRYYASGGDYGTGVTVYDTSHRLIAQTTARDLIAPQFGPDGKVFALDSSGDVIQLALALPTP